MLTRFLGRERAVAELVEIVEAVRLVTLVGAPGCGKTRLGRELSGRLAGGRPSGVCFVELAPVGDPSLAAGAVAAALGVDERPRRSPEDALVEELSGQDLLVVLDNCEHVLGAIAALVAQLLAGCPSLRVLGTSRSALGLRDEEVWRLPPLDLGSAIELFRERAGLSAPVARLGASGGRAIEEICGRLDGLPLAIELVAAWSGVLTPAEILERLDPALPLLRARRPDASPREQTMEATIDWSCQLLRPAERWLLGRLSAFPGGFDLAAAQAVAPGEDVLDGLASLVDHSLVVAEPVAERMRYRLPEPVRQCAAARLASRGEAGAALARSGEGGEPVVQGARRETDDGRDCPLSARELEIADLIGTGLTNREIAQRLFISTRTVESHVDHIKAKLEFARRARIVAWALDRRRGERAVPGSGPQPGGVTLRQP